ncbi:TetR/AcrR family transcriptional regulator [Ruicaihuangia caeni]|uniref:Helix-turn-helix domain-containing protein n=1 Tax=Ruicaihuangia caeni TaxID=3042517 RepID=A0AAW6TAX0_9MICO|nr:TetR/AcrR family transcriptional regulator [Klugiella sp. YN-L-19]MDI2099478.1 helix-turn-helix domain-containing protein [Klugiella sp. YN-L-19]
MADLTALKAAALTEFAASGYLGTSIARIAERAGVSKASVLYHFESKEALLASAVGSAIEELEHLLDRVGTGDLGLEERKVFVEGFVQFLLRNRLAVHIFMNQRGTLADLTVMRRADALIERIAQFLMERTASLDEHMRFGIALGGAAYLLANAGVLPGPQPDDIEVRESLNRILIGLLVPEAAR